MFFAAFLDIATTKDITPYMHELHGNLGARKARCMEHYNMEIKEGFRKGSNHQPMRLLKSGKLTLSMIGQIMMRNTLMAHHRDMHGTTHRAQPHLPKAKAYMP
eukprot:jgi/Tetstr1/448348/TSEL_035631.t1